MATEKKKTFLSMILMKHRNALPGGGIGSSLLGLAEQDGQASARNDPCILSCLRQGVDWPPHPVFLMVPYTHRLFEFCLGSYLGSM